MTPLVSAQCPWVSLKLLASALGASVSASTNAESAAAIAAGIVLLMDCSFIRPPFLCRET